MHSQALEAVTRSSCAGSILQSLEDPMDKAPRKLLCPSVAPLLAGGWTGDLPWSSRPRAWMKPTRVPGCGDTLRPLSAPLRSPFC